MLNLRKAAKTCGGQGHCSRRAARRRGTMTCVPHRRRMSQPMRRRSGGAWRCCRGRSRSRLAGCCGDYDDDDDGGKLIAHGWFCLLLLSEAAIVRSDEPGYSQLISFALAPTYVLLPPMQTPLHPWYQCYAFQVANSSSLSLLCCRPYLGTSTARSPN